MAAFFTSYSGSFILTFATRWEIIVRGTALPHKIDFDSRNDGFC